VRRTKKDILEKLYSAHYRQAILYTMALGAGEEEARDIVASAFVKAYLSLPQEVTSFRPWLFRVCRNLLTDRRRKDSRLVFSDTIPETAFAPSPEEELIAAERRRELWRELSLLPGSDREILFMHYFAGISMKDIAAVSGMSHAAVRQRISRLRLQLRKRLEEKI